MEHGEQGSSRDWQRRLSTAGSIAAERPIFARSFVRFQNQYNNLGANFAFFQIFQRRRTDSLQFFTRLTVTSLYLCVRVSV